MPELTELFLLALALSADSFAVALSYGVNKTRLSKLTILMMSGFCGLMLALSTQLGRLAGGFMSDRTLGMIAFAVLLVMGLAKLLQRKKALGVKTLSFWESLVMGFTMSVDSLFAGLGSGGVPVGAAAAAAILATLVTAEVGNRLGFFFAKSVKLDISKLGGIILIILAFTKLVE